MKKAMLLFIVWIAVLEIKAQHKTFELSKATLKDKIMGGWAGQTIGVTFGGPYEFRYLGTFIGDYQPLLWQDGYVKKTMLTEPGLFDDLYMDLTFVAVFEKFGLDAPADSFANAFANANYELWHANQAGRYNIRHGINAPSSGYWKNNPHADCIDYQIESDFSGLMSPGMPNTASAISDKIGHIMNYGDGWYGGVFVGAMYALAFTSTDIHFIVREALKTIPEQSAFYQCIADVMAWHKKFPNDWKQTWFEVQKKWADEVGCPDGVFAPFNIDAKLNAAYVVIGLLYGEGDFTQTLEITTRCGQDADCNPSTAGGVLGTMHGYNQIPDFWKKGLKEAEEIDFKYTTMSLNKVYDMGYRHALKNIEKNGGSVTETSVRIKTQQPLPVRYEKNFAGLYPVAITNGTWSADKDSFSFAFEGTGFVVKGSTVDWNNVNSNWVCHAELYIDGRLAESPQLPSARDARRTELCWKYDLPKGRHQVQLKMLNPLKDQQIQVGEVIVYSDTPATPMSARKLE